MLEKSIQAALDMVGEDAMLRMVKSGRYWFVVLGEQGDSRCVDAMEPDLATALSTCTAAWSCQHQQGTTHDHQEHQDI